VVLIVVVCVSATKVLHSSQLDSKAETIFKCRTW